MVVHACMICLMYLHALIIVSILTVVYLDNPFPSGVNLEVRCSHRPNDPLQGWSWSPYGREFPVLEMLNTSAAKYTESGSTLHINGVNTTDEGLYRCVYQSESFENNLYIHVYGKFLL